jgi:hypothetical protein
LILFLGAKNILFYYLCYAFILLVKYLKKIKMICSNSSN